VDTSRATRLVLAIVQICDVKRLVQRLVSEGFGATRLDAYGGFLRKESSLVIVATTNDGLPRVRAAARELCPRRVEILPPTAHDGTLGLALAEYGPERVEVGGAVLLIVPIERVEYLQPALVSSAPGRRSPSVLPVQVLPR
jgi:uncharacterized protein YaaQ